VWATAPTRICRTVSRRLSTPANPGPPQAPKGFSGILNYRTNTFNKQQFDLSISGPLGNNWYYAISTYQNIDPGYSKLAFNSMNNKLRMYRGSLTKVFNHNLGDISLTYRYAYTEDLFPRDEHHAVPLQR
jgi:hypothetical protein